MKNMHVLGYPKSQPIILAALAAALSMAIAKKFMAVGDCLKDTTIISLKSIQTFLIIKPAARFEGITLCFILVITIF